MSATRERGARLGEAFNRVAQDARVRVGVRWGGRGGVRSGAHRRAKSSWLANRRNPRLTLAAGVAGLIVILGAFYMWFRDSPFVTISRVQVTGLSGPEIPQIEQALRGAAMKMSTLDVNIARLRTAVDPYHQVTSLTVQTQFPHGAVIHVSEEVPIAEVGLGTRTAAVSKDGTLLPATASDSRLPRLSVGSLPSGDRLTGAGPRAALAVLAAAPYSFLSHIQKIAQSSQNGLVAQVRRGPQLRFGDTTQLHAKWEAALAVLANSSSQGASYIDVTDPGRPAAGAPTASTSTTTSAPSSATSATSSATTSAVTSATTNPTPPPTTTSTTTQTTG